MITLSPQPTCRSLAMLRAVAAGRAELSWGSEPDLYIDGLPCDYVTAHELAHADLIRPRWPVLVGRRAPAVLTDAGRSLLSEGVPVHAHAS